MDVGALSEAAARPGTDVAFTLEDVPLDELLLTLHTARFTGAVRVGEPPDADRLCFREGAFVGLRPRPSRDAAGLREAVLGLRLVSAETLAAVSDDGTAPARSMAKALVERGLVSAADLQRATEEHTRRRLFALYDLSPATAVRVRQGLDQVAGFWPVSMDVRPVVAFGMVVRADPRRRAAMMDKVRGRLVRLLSPYDERRNSYGLPPPVVLALKSLEEGARMVGKAALPGLTTDETAGLLLLLDRMALLRVD